MTNRRTEKGIHNTDPHCFVFYVVVFLKKKKLGDNNWYFSYFFTKTCEYALGVTRHS